MSQLNMWSLYNGHADIAMGDGEAAARELRRSAALVRAGATYRVAYLCLAAIEAR